MTLPSKMAYIQGIKILLYRLVLLGFFFKNVLSKMTIIFVFPNFGGSKNAEWHIILYKARIWYWSNYDTNGMLFISHHHAL